MDTQIDVQLGASERLPAIVVLPFMLYQLAGFGTFHEVVSKPADGIINIGVLPLINSSYVANCTAHFGEERILASVRVVIMAGTVW